MSERRSHVFGEGDRYLDSDAVFGVRSSLIGDFVRYPPGKLPDGSDQSTHLHVLDFDFILEPAVPTSRHDDALIV